MANLPIISFDTKPQLPASAAPLTRRTFLKRTGGATVATFVAFNVVTTRRATALPTETSKKPGLQKADPTDCDSNGVCLIDLKSSSKGRILIEENKGGDPKRYEKRFEGEIYWKVTGKLTLPKAPKGQDGKAKPVKQECFQCTGSDVKVSLVVVKLDGGSSSYTNAITNELNAQLATTFGDMTAANLVSGVSATAKKNDAVDPVIETSDPGVRESSEANNKKVRFKLDSDVDPWNAEDSATKKVTWIFSPSKGPEVKADDGTLGIMKAAANRKVTRPNHELREFTMPKFEFGDAKKPTQSGTAGMFPKVGDGATCNLPAQ